MADLRDRTDLPYRFFKPNNSNRWYIRFSISGFPQIKYALGTADDKEALRIAAEKYQDAVFQAKHGILAGNRAFRSVALDYVKSLYARAEREPNKLGAAKSAEAVIKNYLNPFFMTTAITAITPAKLNQYTEWRRTYWTTGKGSSRKYAASYMRNGREVTPLANHVEASDTTLKRENVVLRGVFKHAVRKGLLKPGDVPQQELPRARSDKRPAFTVEQFTKLVYTSERRLAEAFGKPEIFFARAMLHEFICIAADTGLRPKEMFNLNWEHIEGLDLEKQRHPKDTPIRIHAYGKSKYPAPMIPTYTVVGNLQSIAKNYQKRFGTLPSPKTPVFCNLRGERITTFNKSLNALLDACDLRTDAFGRKFSSYSFRHYYATQALRNPKIDIYRLANNMVSGAPPPHFRADA